jgi:TetR/AcrR family transcriptional regulator, transcriptional repressor for nem operon
MSRSSRADTARHHQELIGAASRLFRERGAESVSVPDVMAEIGLSRGGFYKHFESKEALVAAAIDAAFDQHAGRVEQFAGERSRDPGPTRAAFLDYCLSTENRDGPAVGCPSPFVADVARTEPGDLARQAFLRGTYALLDELRAKTTTGDLDPAAQEEVLLADLATTVGAILLARATAGDPLSDAILTAARRRLG